MVLRAALHARARRKQKNYRNPKISMLGDASRRRFMETARACVRGEDKRTRDTNEETNERREREKPRVTSGQREE